MLILHWLSYVCLHIKVSLSGYKKVLPSVLLIGRHSRSKLRWFSNRWVFCSIVKFLQGLRTHEFHSATWLLLASFCTIANFWPPQGINYFIAFFPAVLDLQKEHICSCFSLFTYVCFPNIGKFLIAILNHIPNYFSHDLAPTEQLQVLKFAFNEKPESYMCVFLVCIGDGSLNPTNVLWHPPCNWSSMLILLMLELTCLLAKFHSVIEKEINLSGIGGGCLYFYRDSLGFTSVFYFWSLAEHPDIPHVWLFRSFLLSCFNIMICVLRGLWGFGWDGENEDEGPNNDSSPRWALMAQGHHVAERGWLCWEGIQVPGQFPRVTVLWLNYCAPRASALVPESLGGAQYPVDTLGEEEEWI